MKDHNFYPLSPLRRLAGREYSTAENSMILGSTICILALATAFISSGVSLLVSLAVCAVIQCLAAYCQTSNQRFLRNAVGVAVTAALPDWILPVLNLQSEGFVSTTTTLSCAISSLALLIATAGGWLEHQNLRAPIVPRIHKKD